MRTSIFVGLSLPLLLITSSAAATPEIDQQFVSSGRTYGLVGGPLERSQTFTVGLAGRLTSFEVWLANNTGDVVSPYDLAWGIFGTTDGVPDEMPLSSGVMSLELRRGSQQLVLVDVSAAAIQVAPGDVLAFSVGNTAPQLSGGSWFIYGASGSSSPLYDGGSSFARLTDGSQPELERWTEDESVDWSFATRVDPAAVPEPSSGLLLAAALSCCLTSERRGRG